MGHKDHQEFLIGGDIQLVTDDVTLPRAGFLHLLFERREIIAERVNLSQRNAVESDRVARLVVSITERDDQAVGGFQILDADALGGHAGRTREVRHFVGQRAESVIGGELAGKNLESAVNLTGNLTHDFPPYSLGNSTSLISLRISAKRGRSSMSG